MEKFIRRVIEIALNGCIYFYKNAFLINAGSCRYYPSCSAYAREALHTLPVTKALWLIIKRILSCNPFQAGGYDPVPEHSIIEEEEKNSE